MLKFTFWLDAGLLLGFCAAESTGFTGMIVHEWLGIALTAMVLVHLLLSWTWIATSTRRFFAVSMRTRVNYLLNLCLFGSATAVIASGLLISREAIPAVLGIRADVKTDYQWGVVHDKMSDLVLIIAALHLAINWDWSVTVARKIFRAGAR